MTAIERAKRRLWRRQLEIDRHFRSLIEAKKEKILFGKWENERKE